MTALFVWALAATAHTQSFKVEWAVDRISVAASGAALPAVLAEVGRQANIRFVGLDRIAATLDADVQSALLLDALETLLAGVNYVMSRPAPDQTDARLVVWLHPRTAGVPVTGSAAAELEDAPAAPPPASVDVQGSALLENLVKTEEPQIRLQALQKLAARDEYETLTLQLIESALEDPDAAVRSEAFELLGAQVAEGKVLERIDALLAHPNPAVRLTAVSSLRARTGDEVTRLLNRALADDDSAVRIIAEELLREGDVRE